MRQLKQILSLLKDRGLSGVHSYELNQVGYRYSSRIHELRKQGHKIVTMMKRPNEAIFIYVGER